MDNQTQRLLIKLCGVVDAVLLDCNREITTDQEFLETFVFLKAFQEYVISFSKFNSEVEIANISDVNLTLRIEKTLEKASSFLCEAAARKAATVPAAETEN